MVEADGAGPDPSGAYREAVRAVEAVAKPVILPNNDRATLGQMESVWTGQLDRHGTDDETVPLNVSPAEADAAFSACLNLVRLLWEVTSRLSPMGAAKPR